MRLTICFLFGITMSLFSQETQSNIVYESLELSGPRLGVTYLSDSFTKTIKDEADIKLEPFMAQFGWQFEKRFFSISSGATAVSEWIVLIGGFEQEKFLPSISWLIGMRSAEGFEIGAGPNLSASGTSVVIAGGVTLQSGEINFPINLAVATSKSGPRVSLLFGFNIRKTKGTMRRVHHRRPE